MTQTLTQLISSVQAALIDDGTRFTTATVTQAVREALKDWNEYAPVFAAERITVVADQKEYELTDTDSRAISILNIWLYDDTGKSDHAPLLFDQYLEDERLFFRLREAQSTSEELLVAYTIPQTISGLDSETESTLSAHYDQILIGGAKANAMQYRADSRIEPINLQQQVSDNYREQIEYIRAKFMTELKLIAGKRNFKTGSMESAAWNDGYHGWPA